MPKFKFLARAAMALFMAHGMGKCSLAVAQVSEIKGSVITSHKAAKNFVRNGEFEVNELGVTDASTIATRTTSAPLSGKASSAINASASTQKVLYEILAFGDNYPKNSNCEASFLYTGDASAYKAYIEQAGSPISAEITLRDAGTDTTRDSINYPCGDGSAAQALVIEATADGAAIKVDNIYAGEATNIGTVAQAHHLGSVYYPATGSCLWSRTGVGSDSFGVFSADTDCSSATVTGKASAPGTKIPAIVFPSIPAGRLVCTASGAFARSGTAAASATRFRLHDGSTAGATQSVYVDATGLTGAVVPVVVGEFSYPSGAGSTTINVQGLTTSTSNAVSIDATGTDFFISCRLFPESSQVVATQPVPFDAPNIVRYTSGSGTYTPSPQTKYIIVTMVGGGGGGGASGTASFGSSTGGTDTTFGANTARAGNGGGQSGNVLGGTVTVGLGTTLVAQQGTHAPGPQYDGGSASQLSGGDGGTSCLGGAGPGGAYAVGGGVAIANTGSGGGGAGRSGVAAAYTGGGGSSGGCIKVLIVNPQAVSYGVGTKGVGGTAGTNGFAGGDGADGVIIIEEYFGTANAPLYIGAVQVSNTVVDRALTNGVTTIRSGTYTTTISNTTNIASNGTPYCRYMRIGTIVTGSCSMLITCTAASPTSTVFDFTLPVARATTFSQTELLAGTMETWTNSAGGSGAAGADTATNNEGRIFFMCGTTSSVRRMWTFTYSLAE